MRWIGCLVLAACSYDPSSVTLGEPTDGPASDATVDLDSPTDGPSSDGTITSIVADPHTSARAPNFSSTLSFMHTVGPGSNRVLVVGISISFAGSQATSVTFNGSALTRAGARDAPSSDGRVEIWSLVAPPSGAHPIDITLDDASSTLIAGAASFSNVNQASPLGSFVGASAMAGSPSIAVTTTTGEVAFGVVMWNGGDYSNLTGNEQAAWNRNSVNLGSCCSIVGAAATSTAASPSFFWTVGGGFNDFWATGAVTVRPD